MMLLILLLFLVHIIAEEDEVCDAEEASETNESTQIPFIFENHLNHRVQAYWISPEDSEQHPVAVTKTTLQILKTRAKFSIQPHFQSCYSVYRTENYC